MDWTSIGALGEVLGAVAVFGTLAYLARQIRGANRIARAEAYRSTRERTSSLFQKWAEDGEFAEILIGILFAGVTREDLTPRQRAVVGINLQAFLGSFAAIHHDVRLGVLPESAYDIVGADIFASPYFKELWPLLRVSHSEEFRTFFEQRYALPATSDSVEKMPPTYSPDSSTN